MARGDPLFAKLEADFFDERPDFMELPEGARFLYLWLWAQAVRQRREFLVKPSISRLSTLSNLHHRWMISYLLGLSKVGLIRISDGFIQVIGVAKKHNKIIFRTEPSGEKVGKEWVGIKLNGDVIELKGIPPMSPQGDSPKPEPKPVKKKLESDHPDPCVSEFIQKACFEFKEKFGTPYPNNSIPRIMREVKSAVGSCPVDELLNLWRKYLGGSFWFDKKAGKSLNIFFNRLPEIISAESSEVRQQLSGLIAWYEKEKGKE